MTQGHQTYFLAFELLWGLLQESEKSVMTTGCEEGCGQRRCVSLEQWDLIRSWRRKGLMSEGAAETSAAPEQHAQVWGKKVLCWERSICEPHRGWHGWRKWSGVAGQPQRQAKA